MEVCFFMCPALYSYETSFATMPYPQ